MKNLRLAVAFIVVAVGALFLIQPFTSAAAGTTYAADSFTRTLTNTWGSADTGGAYSFTGLLADFDTNGSAGLINSAANATHSATLGSVSALNVDLTFAVQTNKSSAGGGQLIYFVARRSGSNDYVGRVRFSTDNAVRLIAGREVSGAMTLLGTEQRVTRVNQVAKTYIRVRVQVTGTYPTTIRLRAWSPSQAEPTTWDFSVTDSTSALQAAGAVGVRTYLSSAATNAPVLFNFDNLAVTDASSAPAPTSTAIAPSPTPAPTQTATPPPAGVTRRLYWGALVNGQSPSSASLSSGGAFYNFESRAGKKMSILHWGQPWKMNGSMQSFQTAYFNNVRAHGSIPMINWASWELGMGINQTSFKLSNITAGNYDTYIRNWATAAKSWGYPFFLRFDHEMNGWWYPWAEGKQSNGVIPNGNAPGDYVKAWRHVRDIFTSVGATNATWVWCANHESTSTQYPPLSQVYPGDAYVDWTCLDGYNKYSTWISFNQVLTGSGLTWLRNSYSDLVTLAPSKPIMIGETASLEAGDGGAKKAAWITDALKTQLINGFPNVKAFVWFNWNDGDPTLTFPIESTSASVNAFAGGISLPNYMPNQYPGLNISPIPPP